MDFFPTWALWLGFALLLFAAEMLTTGFFLFPFGVGAAVAAIADLLGLSLIVQGTIFVTVSGVLLLFSRRLARAFDRAPPSRAGADRLIGLEGIVISTIDPERNEGRVRVDNEDWRAEALERALVEKGTRVTVLAIKGARIVVRPLGG